MEKLEGGWGFLLIFFLLGLGLVFYSFSSESFAIVFSVGVVFIGISILPVLTLFIDHYSRHREPMIYAGAIILIAVGALLYSVAGFIQAGLILMLFGALILVLKFFFFSKKAES
jgi:hypothetical protein